MTLYKRCWLTEILANSLYLKLDGSNANTNISIGEYNFSTTGDVSCAELETSSWAGFGVAPSAGTAIKAITIGPYILDYTMTYSGAIGVNGSITNTDGGAEVYGSSTHVQVGGGNSKGYGSWVHVESNSAGGDTLYGHSVYMGTDHEDDVGYGFAHEVKCASLDGIQYAFFADACYDSPRLKDYYGFYATGEDLVVSGSKWGVYVKDLNSYFGGDISTIGDINLLDDKTITLGTSNFWNISNVSGGPPTLTFDLDGTKYLEIDPSVGFDFQSHLITTSGNIESTGAGYIKGTIFTDDIGNAGDGITFNDEDLTNIGSIQTAELSGTSGDCTTNISLVSGINGTCFIDLLETVTATAVVSGTYDSGGGVNNIFLSSNVGMPDSTDDTLYFIKMTSGAVKGSKEIALALESTGGPAGGGVLTVSGTNIVNNAVSGDTLEIWSQKKADLNFNKLEIDGDIRFQNINDTLNVIIPAGSLTENPSLLFDFVGGNGLDYYTGTGTPDGSSASSVLGNGGAYVYDAGDGGSYTWTCGDGGTGTCFNAGDGGSFTINLGTGGTGGGGTNGTDGKFIVSGGDGGQFTDLTVTNDLTIKDLILTEDLTDLGYVIYFDASIAGIGSIDGDLVLYGDEIRHFGSCIPSAAGAFEVGTTDRKWDAFHIENGYLGDGTNDVTLTFDGGNDGTIKWWEDEEYFELSGYLTTGGSSSGQSIIDSGLVVNEGGYGADATSDLRVETISNANAFLVDSSEDEVKVGVASKLGDGGTTNYTEIKADGEINLHGTARVKRGLWFDATGMKTPGTKPATYVDHGISGAWEFSNGTDDTIVFNLRVPTDMDRTVAPSVVIGWSTSTTVTTETCVWQLEYLITAAGDDTTAVAQDTVEVHSNAIAQANGLIIAEFTGLDAAGDDDVCVHCRLKRLGADADDDLTDTAELMGVCLTYTSDKFGEAT